MKAIVLSCDRYRPLTEHMTFQYGRLWPDHPFVFRIPYQQLAGRDDARHEYRQTPFAIKATVLALLEGLPDEEWIYWCIDDKYPVWLDLPRIRDAMQWAESQPTGAADGVLFCRARSVLSPRAFTGQQTHTAGRQLLLRQKAYGQIWVHQLLRVRVLRHLFACFPDAIPQAKSLDALLRAVALPPDHALWVTSRNHAVFGESTQAGRLTANARDSFVAHGRPVPAMPVDESVRIHVGERAGAFWIALTRAWLKALRRPGARR
ncbi:MAG TPA: hypothetical protein VM369_05275 [Candidatus Binatia bacterium]|nr:hypothetical protein [Candidatus Binatia bacterium]